LEDTNVNTTQQPLQYPKPHPILKRNLPKEPVPSGANNVTGNGDTDGAVLTNPHTTGQLVVHCTETNELSHTLTVVALASASASGQVSMSSNGIINH
jgi:hypothetical protein